MSNGPHLSHCVSSWKDSTHLRLFQNTLLNSFSIKGDDFSWKITWQEYNMTLTGPGFKRNPEREWPVNGRSSFSPMGGLSTTERRLKTIIKW